MRSAALPFLAALLVPGPPLPAAESRVLVKVDGGAIDVVLGPHEPPVPQEALLGWVRRSAEAVTTYYGRFPVPLVRLSIVTGGARSVGGGTTWPGDVPRIRIHAGRAATSRALDTDWVLTHEMAHLALPNLPEGFAWMEEGLATYVEPVARARAGHLPAEKVWRDILDGMPRGLPKPGVGGLDGTRSWGRTYWGGALFWLLADVAIREQSGNRKGLEHALRGILAEGGSIREDWTPGRVLDTGDRAVGLTVLRDLHARHGPRAVYVDLAGLFRRLGVERTAESVRFDDAAPASAVRRAITARP